MRGRVFYSAEIYTRRKLNCLHIWSATSKGCTANEVRWSESNALMQWLPGVQNAESLICSELNCSDLNYAQSPRQHEYRSLNTTRFRRGKTREKERFTFPHCSSCNWLKTSHWNVWVRSPVVLVVRQLRGWFTDSYRVTRAWSDCWLTQVKWGHTGGVLGSWFMAEHSRICKLLLTW